MATVYILYSEKSDQFYIGSCIDFEKRLIEHVSNVHKLAFTRKTNDWEAFLIIENLEYQQARQIEKHIKSMKSKKYVYNLKTYPEITEKLKLKYCDAGSFR